MMTMAKQNRGPRGERDAPGPPGPVGPIGQTGAAGRRGASGKVGKPTLTRSSDRLDILSVVEEQIDDIHIELDIQMKRIAQLEVRLDEVRDTIRKMIKGSN
jgi:hypothetical protein